MRLAERGWEFFIGLAPENVFLAGLLKLLEGAEMLSVDIGESVRECARKIRAQD